MQYRRMGAGADRLTTGDGLRTEGYGVGIRSIISTANKYKGMYDFAARDGEFSVKVSLNLYETCNPRQKTYILRQTPHLGEFFYYNIVLKLFL